ncbi:hypothetical protein QIS99_28195 [Streptomyces sp. B-S-A8]|uniref:Uncharacterized protein n=1 Tax=Streptomyces solicavernae TaxID=3043614 RepID=A0ABT6S039_9ACTN|nr:hypothetical protein [Streptomyces sp. B-S-A8]MDI3390043.1 hypothetical protein [Streptomyces sp. B-S-A8]
MDDLAEMLVAALLDGEWAELDDALTGQGQQERLVPLVDRICERLPQRQQQEWTHRKAAVLVGSLADALTRERDGSAAHERRRRELQRRLNAERGEVAEGIYPPAPGDWPRLALIIVCAVPSRAGGQRCGAERARAFTVPHREPEGPVLIVQNAGRIDRPHRLETRVPPDFSGGTDVVTSYSKRCVMNGHNTLELDGEQIRGGVEMPFSWLREPFTRFAEPSGSGDPVQVPWRPGGNFPTLYRGQSVESFRKSH